MWRFGAKTENLSGAAACRVDLLRMILVIILKNVSSTCTSVIDMVLRSSLVVLAATAFHASTSAAAPASEQPSALASQPPSPPPEQTPIDVPQRAASPLDNVSIWGYGELYYARPSKDEGRTIADLRRAVFGLGYRFSPKVVFNSEWEVEHAIASAGDSGEFEIEQLYVDFQALPELNVTAGLFLMPFGLLNEHHEPTHFYGVQRNFVETEIIPSTWREGGLSLHGDFDFGLGYSAGIVTNNSFRGWEFSSDAPPYVTAFDLESAQPGPLQSTHQELQRADASHLAGFLSLNYHGIPGFVIGAAATTGKATAPLFPDGTVAPQPRVTLWEAHARWTPGRLDLSALYAEGRISDTAQVNAANPEATNPIPSRFWGFYAQAAYTVYEDATFRLSPFARFERYDLGASYEGTSGPVVPPGRVQVSQTPGDVAPFPVNNDKVWTVGANFYITQGVVVKADYQWFANNSNFDRLDLGLGIAF